MSKITVDLNLRVVEDTNRVWRVFPGHGYKFLSSYLDQEAMFLDIPGFELFGRLNYPNDNVLRRLAYSEKIIETKHTEGSDAEIDFSWTSTEPARRSQGRGLLATAVNNMYYTAQKDDVVVMPSQNWLNRIYLGVIRDQKYLKDKSFFEERYGNAPIPSRSVEWLAVVAENKMSPDLSASLRHQNPFNVVERSFYNEIYAFAFTNYVFGEERGSIIYNTLGDYIDRDAALLGLLSQVSASICKILDNKTRVSELDLLGALLDQRAIEYSCSQTADIHSPGLNRFLSSKNTPILLASLLAVLAFLGANSNEKNLREDIKSIEVTNSISGPDEGCARQVHSGTKLFLDTTRIDEVWRLCKLARDAQQRAGVQSGVSVSSPGKPTLNPPKKAKPK